MSFYTDRLIMTPGPTEIPERIRRALLRETTNPDLDPEFIDVYNRVRDMLGRLLGVRSSSLYIMSGEAMLGLEAAIANTVKPGDKIMVIANGVFGEGFGDLVRSYGGKPVYVAGDEWRKSVDLEDLDRALEKNKDAIAVTLVHCDTPSALLNDLRGVARVVRDHGLLLIVDAVSSIGGVPVDFEGNSIDILIGGSQKVLNTPPGLTIIAISRRAWDRINEVRYSGFYLNLRLWREMLDEQSIFPYTMSDVLVYALEESLKMIFEEGVENTYKRHENARKASWSALEVLNLKPYPISIEHSSPTVTAFIAEGFDERRLREIMWKRYGIMIAGSWGKLQNKVLRIGHMGVQASRSHLLITYASLARALRDLGFEISIGRVVEAIENSFKS
ncbi:MAG: alanine--glyoxylate aminotransferase family protein [Sulfolobales archaeon]